VLFIIGAMSYEKAGTIHYCDQILTHSMSLGGPSSVVVNLLTNAAVGIVRHFLCCFLKLKNFSAILMVVKQLAML